MLYNFYQFVHHSIGIHFWDIPALVTGLTMIAAAIGHNRFQRKREDDMQEELEKKLEAISEIAQNAEA